MIRYALLFTLAVITLYARENPFFPAEGMQEMPVTAAKVDTYVPLQRAAISLPDSARVLKEVQVTFQNLDGTIDTRTITLDHGIDWHLPLFISQSYSATKPEDALPVKTTPPPITHYAPLVDFGDVAFSQSGNTLKIGTKDSIIRHFMLVDPHRIVIDFKRDANFRSKLHKIQSGKPFTQIRLGNHKGYYRAVIELDGQYRYELNTHENAMLLRCF